MTDTIKCMFCDKTEEHVDPVVRFLDDEGHVILTKKTFEWSWVCADCIKKVVDDGN